MAPRRGGGGGSGSGSSISACPGAFSDTYDQVSFACTVIFFVVFFGISIALCFVRKKSGAGKKLIGLPYILALFLFLITYALDLVASVLVQCDTVDYSSYYPLLIATYIFSYLGKWALLFVVVYTLNIKLRREHLGSSIAINSICIAIVAIMFAVTCGQIGLSCYNLWTQTEDGYIQDAAMLTEPEEKLRVAYTVLYLLSVVASGALSLKTVFAMRSRRLPGGDLLIWVTALIFSMVAWSLLVIVFAAAFLQDDFAVLEFETSAALSYIVNFFQALSFIILLCIAKHAAWSKTTMTTGPQSYAPVIHDQPVYAHHGTHAQQNYY